MGRLVFTVKGLSYLKPEIACVDTGKVEVKFKSEGFSLLHQGREVAVSSGDKVFTVMGKRFAIHRSLSKTSFTSDDGTVLDAKLKGGKGFTSVIGIELARGEDLLCNMIYSAHIFPWKRKLEIDIPDAENLVLAVSVACVLWRSFNSSGTLA